MSTEQNKKLIAQLLERQPAIEERLSEVAVIDDVLDNKIKHRKGVNRAGVHIEPLTTIDAGTGLRTDTGVDDSKCLTYLPKGSLEPDKEYGQRVNMTPFFPQTPGILNERQGCIFKEPPTLTGTGANELTDFEERATSNGQSMLWCIVRTAELLQRHGFQLIFVDKAPLPADVNARAGEVTVAEKNERKLGLPQLSLYSAHQVLWIEHDATGLKYVKLLETQTVKPTWDAEPVEVKIVRIVDRTSVTMYKIEDGKKIIEGPVTVPHGCTVGVPCVVAKAFSDEQDKLGRPVLGPSAEADVAAMQQLSNVLWSLFVLGNPLLVWTTSETEQKDLVTGATRYIKLRGSVGNAEPETLGYCQLDPTGMNLMMAMFQKFRDICLQSSGKDSATAVPMAKEQSGVSKAWSFKTGEERLLFCLTRQLEEAYDQVLKIVCSYMNVDPETVEIKFNESFDLGTPKDKILVVQQLVGLAEKYQLETLAKAGLKQLVSLAGTLTEKEENEVMKEIEALSLQAPNRVAGADAPVEGQQSADPEAAVKADEDEENDQ